MGVLIAFGMTVAVLCSVTFILVRLAPGPTRDCRLQRNHAELARIIDHWLDDEMIVCTIPEAQKEYAAELVEQFYGTKRLDP